MKKVYSLIIFFCIFVIVGCVNESTETSNESLQALDLQKKVDIIQSHTDKESTLSIMLHKISVEWPSIYIQKSEEDLFQYYSELTWHVDDFEKENLLSNIANHKEYLKVKDLYESGKLPAKDVKLKSLHIESKEDGYNLEAIYEIRTNDSLIEDNIVFTVGPTMELFNIRFLSFKDYGELPVSPQDLDKQMLAYLLFDSLSINQKLKMTLKEKNFLLDFKE